MGLKSKSKAMLVESNELMTKNFPAEFRGFGINSGRHLKCVSLQNFKKNFNGVMAKYRSLE